MPHLHGSVVFVNAEIFIQCKIEEAAASRETSGTVGGPEAQAQRG